MGSVIIEIPPDFAKSFGATEDEASRNACLELAIAMYRAGKWSAGKAAEFAKLPVSKLVDLLRDRDIPVPYTSAMLEQDVRHGGGCL
jgi:predicted HTH domain antitoxin